MKIFVTGGTGFIGCNFINAAIKNEHEIIAQRRPGSQTRIKLAKQPIWIDRQLDGDFKAELEACDVLVHLAAHTPNPPYATLSECMYWNVHASVKLIEQAVESSVTKFLITGTCFEYGSSAREYDFIHPAAELKPVLSYPISKASATIALTGCARLNNLQMEILRIFQVYGEGEAEQRFWPSLRKAALSGEDFRMSSGAQIRDFINVDDVVKSFIDALEFKEVINGKPQIRNIGTGKSQSLLDFAKFWWEKWEAKGKLMPGEIGLRPNEETRIVANIQDKYVC